ncbi:hypothetical protein GCM10027051_25310 [Niabella terrae]
MNRLPFFILLISLTFWTSCNQQKVINLKRDGDEKMTYYASELHGYSMEILKYIGGQYTQYAVRPNGNGEIMCIYKTSVTKGDDDDGLTAAGPTWYLVSDTTDTIHGAEFLGREILGYYGSKAMNFIRDNDFKGKSISYLDEEKVMFAEVAQLMKEKKQTIIPFDSTRNLFWFKYDLQ